MLIKSFFDLTTSKESTIDVEDDIDRLNWSVSSKLFLLVILILAAKTYWSSNIECYSPTAPSGKDFEKFTKSYSWISEIYTKMPDEKTINDGSLLKEHQKKYCLNNLMWLPLGLGLAALLLYLPHILLTYMSENMVDIDLKKSIRKARKMGRETEVNVKDAEEISSAIEVMLLAQREYRKGFIATVRNKIYSFVPFLVCSKRKGTAFTFGYQATLVMNLFISILILVGMMRYAGFSNISEYKDFLTNIVTGGDRSTSPTKFPVIVYILVRFTEAHGTNTYPTQCGISLNMVWEQMFVGLTVWMIFLVFVNLVKLIVWWYNMRAAKRVTFITSMLCKRDHDDIFDTKEVESFTNEYLKHDGCLLLRLTTANSRHEVTSCIVNNLWKIYLEKHQD